MKHIKPFNELKSSTYYNAANKIPNQIGYKKNIAFTRRIDKRSFSLKKLFRIVENNTPDWENYSFNSGDCGLFAIAMHRLYGFPLVVVRGYFLEPEWGGKREWDYEDAHLLVKNEKGKFVDFDGEISLQTLKYLCMFGEDVKRIKVIQIEENYAIDMFGGYEEEDIKNVMFLIKNKIPKPNVKHKYVRIKSIKY